MDYAPNTLKVLSARAWMTIARVRLTGPDQWTRLDSATSAT